MTNDSDANGRMSVLLLSLLLAMSAFATVAVATTGGSMSGDSGNGFMMNMEGVTAPDNADGSYNLSQYIMADLNTTGLQNGYDYSVHYGFVDGATGTMVHENWDNWTQMDDSGHHVTYASYYPINAGCYGFSADLMNEYTDTNGSTFMASDAWVHWGFAVDMNPADCYGGPGPGPMSGAQIQVSHDNQRQELDVDAWNMSDSENYTIQVWIVDKDEGQNSHMPHVDNLMHNWVVNNTWPADAGWTMWELGPTDENGVYAGVQGVTNYEDEIPVTDEGCWGAVGIISTTFQDGNINWMMSFDEWQNPVDSHAQCNSWFDGQGPQPMEHLDIENFNFDWMQDEVLEMDIKVHGLDTSKAYSYHVDLYWVDDMPEQGGNWDPMVDLTTEQHLPDYTFEHVFPGSDGETQIWEGVEFGDSDGDNVADLDEACYFVMVILKDQDMNMIGGDGAHFQVGEWKCMEEPPMPDMDLAVNGVTCVTGVDDWGEYQDCRLDSTTNLETTYTAHILDVPKGPFQWCAIHLNAPMMGMDADPDWASVETCGDANASEDSDLVTLTGSLLAGHNSHNMLLFYVMFEHQHDNMCTGPDGQCDMSDPNDPHHTCDANCDHSGDTTGHEHNEEDCAVTNTCEQECEEHGGEWHDVVDAPPHCEYPDNGGGDDGFNSVMMPQAVIDHMANGEPFLMEMVSFCSGPLCAILADEGAALEQIFMGSSGPMKAEVWFEQWDDGYGHLNAHMVTTLSTTIREFIDTTLGNSDGEVDMVEAEMFAHMFVYGGDDYYQDYDMTEEDCIEENGDWHGMSADGNDYTEGDEDEHCHPGDDRMGKEESWVLDGVDLGAPDYSWDGINLESVVGPVPTDSGSYDIEIDSGLGWDLEDLSDWATTDTHTLVITDNEEGGLIDPCGLDLGAYGEVIAGDSETWSVQEVTSDAAGWTWNIGADGDAKASFSCGAGSAELNSITIVYAKTMHDWNPENIEGGDKQNETIDWKDEDGDGLADNSPPVCDLYWAMKSGNETSPDFESDTKFEENPNGTYEIELADGASYFIHMFCNDPDGDMISSSWSVGGIAMESYLDASEGWGWVEFTVPEGVGGTVTIDYAWVSGEHTGSGSVVVTATGDGSGGDLTETIVEGGGSLPGFTAITAVAALVGALLIARRRD